MLFANRVPLMCAAILASSSAAFPQAPFTDAALLTGGAGGYHTYRIPAVVRTASGRVLLFLEGRRDSQSDFGQTDLLLLVSDDRGATWSSPSIVHRDESAKDVTIGNTVPVYDAENDTVVLAFTRNNERVFVTRSENEGDTWAPPRDITADVTPRGKGWFRYWTGPGHGIQLVHGPKRGRMLFPCYHLEDDGERNVMRSHMIYSDDGGDTWHVGQSTEIGPEIEADKVTDRRRWVKGHDGRYHWAGCECMAVERTDGSLYLTVRNQVMYKHTKAYAVSQDAGETWTPLALQDELPGVKVQSGIADYPDDDDKNRILWSSIPETGDRRNLSVYLSEDAARTFPVSRTVFNGPSAYSDLLVLPDKTILLFYEGGAQHRYEQIRLARFTLDWVVGDREPTGR